jgi:hypothetical protein
MILFGAPVKTNIFQTILIALHLALLGIYPLSSVTPKVDTIHRIITLEYKADADVLKWTYWGAIGTLIGAWLGAVHISLDWDRKWQVHELEILAYRRNGPFQL